MAKPSPTRVALRHLQAATWGPGVSLPRDPQDWSDPEDVYPKSYSAHGHLVDAVEAALKRAGFRVGKGKEYLEYEDDTWFTDVAFKTPVGDGNIRLVTNFDKDLDEVTYHYGNLTAKWWDWHKVDEEVEGDERQERKFAEEVVERINQAMELV